MQVRITNKSQSTQYISTDGSDDPNKTVVIGPKGVAVVDIESETQFVKLSTDYRGKLVMRKL